MRWFLAALIAVHGLIHLLGVAKGLGLAELPEITQPVNRWQTIGWLAAAAAMGLAAAMLVAAPRVWWIAGLVAAVLSQAVVLTAWNDARFATVVNVIVLAAAAYGFVSEGPLSLRAEYRREVDARLESSAAEEALSEADLQPLPGPVRAYVRMSGAVGKPPPRHLGIRFRGRLRGSADEAWMDFVAEQRSFLDEPARLFLMRAKRRGLPVDVLHAFRGGVASMRVRLLSVVPLVDARGPEATRAETVTLLNDLCLFAPGALVDPAIRWEQIDDRTARAHYSLGAHTVSAELHFNEAGELVDFVSDDRLMASADGSRFERVRWSTPVGDYRDYGDRKAASRGEGRWHPPGGDFAYIELETVELHVDGEPGRRTDRDAGER